MPKTCMNCKTTTQKQPKKNIAFCQHSGLVLCTDLCEDWQEQEENNG